MSFESLAPDYDRLRSGSGWQQITDRSLDVLAGATRLLDVGCGTGRFAVLAAERLGCRVWAIDPSEAMLAEARRRPGGGAVGWRSARAERLPFRAGWFDAVHLHLVVHHLGDRRAAIGEVDRVLCDGARLLLVTFAPEHFDGYHLTPYFPSIPAIERKRFPDPGVLAGELDVAGFREIERRTVVTSWDAPAAEVLERARARYISTLSELDPAEFEAGLNRLQREVSSGAGPIRQRAEWCLISARRG